MIQKKLVIFVLLSVMAGIFFASAPKSQEDFFCAFCSKPILECQKFYEDDLVIALCTHKPITPGHSLIIPKRHVYHFEELTQEEIQQMGAIIKKVHAAAQKVFGTSSYLLLQKNGKQAGQTVPHVHFHYIPSKAGDSSSLILLLRAVLAQIKGPISPDAMQKATKSMEEALNQDF
jgi:histidine triad (HIT) family protein